MFPFPPIATECMCGISPGMKVMLRICPPVDTLIIPGETLHILLQFERKNHVTDMNILHIMCMHLVSSV